jgi:prophage regulatory protein
MREIMLLHLLRLPAVVAKVGCSPMTLWRKERDGEFPKRVKIGKNAVAWVAEEVDAWIAARVAERDARTDPPEDP